MRKTRTKLIAETAKLLGTKPVSFYFQKYYISLIFLLSGARVRAVLDKNRLLKYPLLFMLDDVNFELDKFDWDFYNNLLREDLGLTLEKTELDHVYSLGAIK